MSMESWGGNLPAGKPVTVATAPGRIDTFAIDAGGRMLHWIARDGVPSPADPLPASFGLPASVPCALALADGSLHVFAIGPGGPLVYWRSADGNSWAAPFTSPAGALPAGWSGLAVTSPASDRVDVFGVGGGNLFHGGPLLHWAFHSAGQLLYPEVVPGSVNQLGLSLLSAISPSPNRLDAFAIGPDQQLWHWTGGLTANSWTGFEKIGGVNLPIRAGSGVHAVASPDGHIEIFAVSGGVLWQWSGAPFGAPRMLPGTGPQGYNLPDGTPAAAFVTPERLELFAIGPGNLSHGGPLLRWRRDAAGAWHGPVQLDGNLAAGAVGLVAAAGRIDAFGIHSGGSNNLLHWPAGVAGSITDAQDGIDQHWQNWARNQAVNPLGHCIATSVEELVAIVKDADRAGKRVRAVGSSWSFSDIAVTSDYIVETNRMNHLLDGVVPAALKDPSNPLHLVHVEAGIKLNDLMLALDSMTPPRAPLTMGGAAGQTLAGVLSTSVHGCDFDRGPVPEMLRAIHLVGPTGEQHWIEPAQGITDGARLQAALGPQVQIHYNDDWFQSVAVSVGTLGIIYSVVIETRPQHDIVQAIQLSSWQELRTQLANNTVFSGDGFVSTLGDGTRVTAASLLNGAWTNQDPPGPFPLRGFQVAIDPAGPAGNPTCYVYTRATASRFTVPAPADPTLTPIISLFWDNTALLEGAIFGSAPAVIAAVIGATPPLLSALSISPAAPLLPLLGASVAVTVSSIGSAAVPLVAGLVAVLRSMGEGAVFDFLGAILNGHPDVITALTKTLTGALVKPGPATRNWAHTAMAPSDDITKLARGLAIEIAYDASKRSYLDFIDDLVKTLDVARAEGLVLGGWFSLRFVGQGHAYLSPQQSSLTCMVEFTGVRALSSTVPILDRLEASARKYGAIRHWGMFRDLGADEVERAFPNLDTWRRVRWALTKSGTRRTFDNPFAERCGLTRAPLPALNFVPASDPTAGSKHAAAYARSRGPLELFAIGGGGTLEHRSQVNGAWSGWFNHGGALKGSPALGGGGDRCDLMAVGTDGALYHTWQSAPGADWSGWYNHGGSFAGSPAFGQHSGGSLEVFVIGRDGVMRNKRQAAVRSGAGLRELDGPPRWSDWLTLGGSFAGSPAAGRSGNNQDLLEVMAVGTDGALYHRWQTAGGGWSDWYNHGGSHTGSPVLARRGTDGALEVMVIGTDGHLRHKSQNGPNSGWSSWTDHGGSLTGMPALGLSGASLEVMAVGTDGQLWHRWQTAPGGGWSAWYSHGGAYVGSPFLFRRADGALEVLVTGKDGNLWHKSQGGPSGGWSAWLSHGAVP